MNDRTFCVCYPILLTFLLWFSSATCMAQATGYTGGEPASYDVTIYVDGSRAAREKDGSQARPFDTMKEGIDAARKSLREGKSTRLLIKPGVYREGNLEVSAGQNNEKREINSDLVLQDAWLRIDRWGDQGEVVIDGSDDWSFGKNVADTDWTPVPGHPGVYSRPWPYNWGLWGGGNGTANVDQTPGQRREMVFIDYGDGRGSQRLTPVILETYDYLKPRDGGFGPSWFGPGVWKHTGFAGLGGLVPGTFGITELSDDPSDDIKPDGKPTDYQPGTLITHNPDGDAVKEKPVVKQSFKKVYADAPTKAPPEMTNRIFIRLPDGADIRKVKIDVSTRETALAIEKRNYVLANVSARRFNGRVFGSPAVRLGRAYYDYYLTNGNALVENVKSYENNATGLNVTGQKSITLRNCDFSDNGSNAMGLVYVHDARIENSQFNRTGWRVHGLGRSWGFVPAAIKTWRCSRIAMVDSVIADSMGKGFYSDSAFQDATFERVEFRNNVNGSMHEITFGPITYTDCKFIDNAVATEAVQAVKLTFDRCEFINNHATIGVATKWRDDGDVMKIPDARTWGDGMLGSRGPRITIDEFAITNSLLTSSRPGARLILLADVYSDKKNYLREIIEEAKYANNRYYLADHPYAFEADEKFLTFEEWTALTKEQGANWGPQHAVEWTEPAAPKYEAGFVWNRQADFKRRAGGRIAVTQQVLDASDQPAWYHAATHGRVGTGLGGDKPWYTSPLDYLGLLRKGQFIYKNGVDWPYAGNDGLGTYNWAMGWNTAGAPVAVWRNPTGESIRVKINGEFQLTWGKNTRAADVVIAHAKSDGTITPLLGESVTKPSDGSPSTVRVTGNVSIAAGERLLFSAFITQGTGHEANLRVSDDVTIELLNSTKRK